jgi:glycerophosphoryl diester phosphodiesterase
MTLPPFEIIAHRGGSLEAPENTLQAVEHGIAVGSDWQEVDVTLSIDGHVVVIHDDTLERTTEGSGFVASHTLATLKTLHAGHPVPSLRTCDRLKSLGIPIPDFGTRFRDATVPSLDDILANPHAHLMIEIKSHTDVTKLATAVVDCIHRHHAQSRVAVGSFQYAMVAEIHRLDPLLALVAIMDTLEPLPLFLQLPISYVAVNTAIAAEAVKHVPHDVSVWSWTVYRAEDVPALVLNGVRGIITDAPQAVMRAFRPC